VEGETMGETEIGKVTHYFTHLDVAAIVITSGELKVGDTIHIKGHTSDFTTTVRSMQIEHKQVEVAKVGDSIGIKVPEHAREHDQVFLVTAD
jgi:translation elongation factor EF-1alpha